MISRYSFKMFVVLRTYQSARMMTNKKMELVNKHTLVCITLLLLVVSSASAGAQNNPVPYSDDELRQLGNLQPGAAGVRSIDLAYEGVRGTPFLASEWLKGSILFRKSGRFSQKVSLNIELEKQLLYYLTSDGTPVQFPSDHVKEVVINNAKQDSMVFQTFSPSELGQSKNDRHQFYQVLFNGSQKFLKFEQKYLQKADYKGAYNADRPYDEYLSNVSYFLQDDQRNFHRIRLKKKAVLKSLENQAAAINRIVKQHKLHLNTEEDVVQLLSWLAK